MLKWSFNFMSMNSIPLFFYEISISKRMNITSLLENTAERHLTSKVQFKNIKVQSIKREPVLDRSVDVNER